MRGGPQKVPRNDSLEQGFGPRETGNRKSAKHTYSLSFFKVSGGPDSRKSGNREMCYIFAYLITFC